MSQRMTDKKHKRVRHHFYFPKAQCDHYCYAGCHISSEKHKMWTQKGRLNHRWQTSNGDLIKKKQKATTTQAYMNQVRKSERQKRWQNPKGDKIQETQGETRRHHGKLKSKLYK